MTAHIEAGRRPVLDSRWRKSSRSDVNGNCLEARLDGERERVEVRDSTDLGGPVLRYPRREWAALIRHLTS